MVEAPEKDRIIGSEEAVAKAILELMRVEEEKVKTLSDLNDEEIGVLSLLETIGESLNIKEINKFVENFCQYRVSRHRLGRREMGSIIAWAGFGVQETGRRRLSLKSLFGGFR